MINQIGVAVTPPDIDTSHRTSKLETNQPRHIIARFRNHEFKKSAQKA